jgi:hypothetical protein
VIRTTSLSAPHLTFGMTAALPDTEAFRVVHTLETTLNQSQPGVAYIMYVLKIWADISARNLNTLPDMNSNIRADIDRLQNAHNRVQAAQGIDRSSSTNQAAEDAFLLEQLAPWLRDREGLPFRVSQEVLDMVLVHLEPAIRAAEQREEQK